MNEIKVAVTSRGITQGHILFHGLPHNLDYWSKIISEGELVLNGEFYQYDDQCNEIVFEGLAGPGLKGDGCTQDECEEQDCQFCICRTVGPDAFLRLPANAEFRRIDSDNPVKDTIQVELTLSDIYEMTNAMIFRATKMIEIQAPEIVILTTLRRAERLNHLLKLNNYSYLDKEKLMELRQQATRK